MRTPPERPITFAHRGARADAPENTLAAFSLALRLGARGLETDVWRTRDGQLVLVHDGHHGPRDTRRPVHELRRAELPADVPSLAELYAACGTAFELSVDVKDAALLDAVVAEADRAGAAERLWVCQRAPLVLDWRSRVGPDVRVVADTRRSDLRADPGGTAALAARLAAAGVDVLNLRWWGWTAARVRAVHDAGLLAFGWQAHGLTRLRRLRDLGVDGLYSDHVRRLVRVVDGPSAAPGAGGAAGQG